MFKFMIYVSIFNKIIIIIQVCYLTNYRDREGDIVVLDAWSEFFFFVSRMNLFNVLKRIKGFERVLENNKIRK